MKYCYVEHEMGEKHDRFGWLAELSHEIFGCMR